MKCPFCHHDQIKVNDSRNAPETNAIRRRRECLKCERRFTTFETIELSIQVQKKEGSYEDFNQDKLISGLMAACYHTTISRDQVVDLATKIKNELMSRQLRTVTTVELGELVMESLKKLDPIAYIRFGCVYWRLTEIQQLQHLMQATHPFQPENGSKI
ncbi:MAG: transcriptional regulator NrdR [Waddliaceae bacterium]